jgi:hypothetical protein
MGDVCEAPGIGDVTNTFLGNTSESFHYDGAPLNCITPSSDGLNPIIEALDALCQTTQDALGGLGTLYVARPTLSDTRSYLRTDNAGIESWDQLTPDTVVGRRSGDIQPLGSTDLYGILGITASAAELNIMDGVTVSAADINRLDGVTGNIQDQIDGLDGSVIGLQKSLEDGYEDFVGDGLDTVVSSGLDAQVNLGRATIDGILVEKSGATILSMVANRDNYIYLDTIGSYQQLDEPIGNPEPVQPAGTIKLAKVETDGSSIVSIIDLRNLYSISNTKLQDNSVDTRVLGVDAVETVNIKDGNVTDDKLSDTTVTPGSYTNTNLTVDQKGRITSASNGPALVPDKNATVSTGGAPVTLYSFNHSLGKYPAVTVIDASGNEIVAGVNHVDVNNIDVTFSPAITNATIICN